MNGKPAQPVIFKLKLIAGICFALAAIIAVAVVSYNNVSNLVSALHEESKPNAKIALLNEIMSDLSDAESGVRTYSITNDAVYLMPYLDAVAVIEPKLARLSALTNDARQHARIDSIGTLVKEKYNVFNQLIALRQDDEVESALNKVITQITEQETEPVSETEKQKVSKFREFFRSKKKEPPPPPPADELAGLQKIVDKIKREEAVKSEASRTKEFELTKTDAAIMNDIRKKVDEIAAVENTLAQSRAQHAERLAGKATNIITLATIIAFILALTLAYFVISFIGKTTRYNRQLAEAKELAERSARAKEEFLANMSHEIRTPMNAILGFSEQLEKTPLDARQKMYAATMKDSIEHLLAVVNDILDHAKLDSGKLLFEKTGFVPLEVMRSVYESFCKMAQEKNITLRLAVDENMPRVLIGDPHRLKQILYNLVGNAIKFTDAGEVEMRAQSALKENGMMELIITVSDTGIGIPQEKLNSIFEDFYQSETSTTRKYGGTGLGLTITKKLVEMQSGSISVSSETGKGSAFTFTIPYRTGSEDALESKVAMPDNPETMLGGLSVLIADDEEYNRLLLETILTRWGMKIALCENGRQAVELIEKNNYALVLMDVRMPELNGLDAAKIIRTGASVMKRVPIIALTAASSTEDINKCKAAGMNEFLSKPFREAELFEKVCWALGIEFQRQDSADEPKQRGDTSGKPYDLSELKRIGSGDDAFVNEMLSIFIQNTRDGMIKIKSAIEKHDWERAGLHAHRLCAPARHLGLKRIVAKLKTIETGAPNPSEHHAIPAIFESLHDEVKTTLDQLQKEITA